MNIKDLFKRRVADIKSRGYTPKFKVGDIILNKKYIIVRKVVNIIGLEGNSMDAQYILKDIHNPLRDSKVIKKFEVFKVCAKIDDYYDVMPEKTARILYGHKD
jgi:hypothetical protein